MNNGINNYYLMIMGLRIVMNNGIVINNNNNNNINNNDNNNDSNNINNNNKYDNDNNNSNDNDSDNNNNSSNNNNNSNKYMMVFPLLSTLLVYQRVVSRKSNAWSIRFYPFGQILVEKISKTSNNYGSKIEDFKVQKNGHICQEPGNRCRFFRLGA